MSKKKQTPIMEAIAWCDSKLFIINSSDVPDGLKEALASPYLQLKQQLQNLLPKEKAFADKAFITGYSTGWAMKSHTIGEITEEELKRFPLFSEFFKQYENE